MRFYFTIHPGDMIAERLIDGSSVMLVASAHWDDTRQRFRIRRPPSNVSSIAIDSGGFTAARRWGKYPWSFKQYVDFIRASSRDRILDFCACMDYACERDVNLGIMATNQERIDATIANDIALRALAPDLPWLSVLQGNTFEERAYDLERRRILGIPPTGYVGLGSVCGRPPVESRQVVKFYIDRLPGVQYHGFGFHSQALDDDEVANAVKSWDSYAWNWGKGAKGKDRPLELCKQPGERYTEFTKRLALFYWQNTVMPRLNQIRQLSLFAEVQP